MAELGPKPRPLWLQSQGFSQRVCHGALGHFLISSQRLIHPINPCQRRTRGVRLKVSCLTLGSPFPVLHLGHREGRSYHSSPATAKQPQTLDQFPELLTCIYLCWLICSSFTTQVGLTQCCQPSRAKGFLRLGGGSLTKRHSSFATGFIHNLRGTKWRPSLTQIMSMRDEHRPGPTSLD